jgi:hypothetical protein
MPSDNPDDMPPVDPNAPPAPAPDDAPTDDPGDTPAPDDSDTAPTPGDDPQPDVVPPVPDDGGDVAPDPDPAPVLPTPEPTPAPIPDPPSFLGRIVHYFHGDDGHGSGQWHPAIVTALENGWADLMVFFRGGEAKPVANVPPDATDGSSHWQPPSDS